MLPEERGEITLARMKRQSQRENNAWLWMWLVIEVKSDAVKKWTWNVRSMNQGKLEVIKQEMARVNTDILGISELKWTAMGEFNSDDNYICYCGQECLRNGVALIINKRGWNVVLGCNLKNERTISVLFQGKSYRITVIQVYAPTANTKEAEVERF